MSCVQTAWRLEPPPERLWRRQALPRVVQPVLGMGVGSGWLTERYLPRPRVGREAGIDACPQVDVQALRILARSGFVRLTSALMALVLKGWQRCAHLLPQPAAPAHEKEG